MLLTKISTALTIISSGMKIYSIFKPKQLPLPEEKSIDIETNLNKTYVLVSKGLVNSFYIDVKFHNSGKENVIITRIELIDNSEKTILIKDTKFINVLVNQQNPPFVHIHITEKELNLINKKQLRIRVWDNKNKSYISHKIKNLLSSH